MTEMRRLVIVLAACAAAACASAAGQPSDAPQRLPQRPLEPDVVDIRGIWRDNSLHRESAIARGLDPDQIQLPRKIRDQRPTYPQGALQTHTTGTVTLDCIIDTAGAPQDCRVVGGPPQLRGAAADAVMAWRWEPLRLAGTPRRAAAYLTVSFTLQAP
jgi:TonB family protein